MNEINNKVHPHIFSKCMKHSLSFMLLALAGILLAFLARETWILITMLLHNHQARNSYEMIEAIVIWFLYFEFVALIAKYFESKFHFPLHYFIYIGITAVVRLIIVDHANPTATLVYSFAILVLLGSLYIANTNLLKRL